MSIGVKAETQILLGLIALFSIGVAVSLWQDLPPVITAICASLMVTACLYRFLGGVEGSRLAVASFKAGGSAAVFGAVLWFVNDQLVNLRLNPQIDPAPTNWIAIDGTGTPVAVWIGQKEYPANTQLLRDAEWRVEIRDGEIRAVASDETLAKVDPQSLDSIGLFNDLSMADNRNIKFTNPLEPGKEADLYPPYPFWIRADDFRDNYNGYSIMDMETDTAIATGLLGTRTFEMFGYEGRTYVILVSQAGHNDPSRAPWAVFGFAEFELSVR
ncbi:MAG: hypothetical protein OXE73_03670 [Gammaproteobacteria bacterium]|nr:hypothetical protein [Gammaproteobacteria bacterium]